MNLQKLTALSALFLILFALLFSLIPATNTRVSTEPVTFSNIAKSEKLVLLDDTARDEKLLLLTGSDRLALKIIDQHSLVVGSKMVIVCRRNVYSWLVNHIRVSAALSQILGRDYRISPSSLYEYHGEDGEGLSVDFYCAYHDSASTIYIGNGKVKIFLFTISGSFINFLEHYNEDDTRMTAQNCMYVMLNNTVTRFLANIIFAVSDIEKGIMEKILSLDDVVFKVVKIFMEDPHLYLMLKEPEAHVPDGASEIAIRIKDAVVQESSLIEARELGQLIQKARIEVGYQQ